MNVVRIAFLVAADSSRQRDETKKTYTAVQLMSWNTISTWGVDRSDQLRNYYALRLKSHKFYKYIFWFTCDVTITNAYILTQYLPVTDDKGKTHLQFRIDLAKQLIGEYMGKKLPGRPSSSSSLSLTRHVTVPHYPLKAEKRS